MNRFSVVFVILNILIVFSDATIQTQIPCKNYEECQFSIDGSICDGGYCSCQRDSMLNSDGTKCMPATARYYGSPCVEDIQCSKALATGGICYNNKCTCKEGYHYLKGLCWKSQGLNQECYWSEQCYDSYEYIGLQCTEQMKCECRDNYYTRLDSGCRRISKVGESCAFDSDCQPCQDQTMKASCESETCKCEESNNTEWSFVSIRQKEYVENQRDEPPTYPRGDCPLGQYSQNGDCKLELGMECINETNFEIENASCIDGILTCQPNVMIARDDNQRCLKASPGKISDLNESSCSSKLECGVYGNMTECEDGKCKCSGFTHWDPNKLSCHPLKYFYGACESDDECFSANGYVECSLHSHTCRCKTGYLEQYGNAGQENEYCLKLAHVIGDQCDIWEACSNIDHSNCSTETHTCQCDEYYFEEKGQCQPGINSDCGSEVLCEVEHSFCNETSGIEEGTCQCEEGYVSSSNFQFCLPVVNLDEKCEETVQCTTGDSGPGEFAECIEGHCKCNESSHDFCGKCYKTIYAGESCINTNYCVPYSECVKCKDCADQNDTTCQCLAHYIAEDGFCKPKINAPCLESEECTDHAVCKTVVGYPTICYCIEGYKPSKDEEFCLPEVIYGEQCNETIQCINKVGALAECRDGVCQCNETAHEYSGLCHETKHLGEKCENFMQCTEGQEPYSVTCKNGVCSCQMGYVQYQGKCHISSDVGYGEQCNDTVQCIDKVGDQAECRDGFCLCDEKAHEFFSRCYETKQLGQKCENMMQCIDGQDTCSVTCKNGLCVCQKGYVEYQGKCKSNSGSLYTTSNICVLTSALIFILRLTPTAVFNEHPIS